MSELYAEAKLSCRLLSVLSVTIFTVEHVRFDRSPPNHPGVRIDIYN